MEMIEFFRALRRRWYLTAIVVVVAIGAAVAMKIKDKSVPTGTATVQILVDSPQSALADLQQDTGPLAERATVFAQVMTSGAVLQSIAQAAGIQPNDLTAEGPYTGAGEVDDVPTPSEARGAQLVAIKPEYRLTMVAQTQIPIITVTVEGPTPIKAGRLADAVYPGVQSWLNQLEVSKSVSTARRVTVRQLGDAQAGAINSSSATVIAGIAAIAVMMLGSILIVGTDQTFRRRRRGRNGVPNEVVLADLAATLDDSEEESEPIEAPVRPQRAATRSVPARAEAEADAEYDDHEDEHPKPVAAPTSLKRSKVAPRALRRERANPDRPEREAPAATPEPRPNRSKRTVDPVAAADEANDSKSGGMELRPVASWAGARSNGSSRPANIKRAKPTKGWAKVDATVKSSATPDGDDAPGSDADSAGVSATG
jgi:capsular polysaccharide biosynthesis protein